MRREIGEIPDTIQRILDDRSAIATVASAIGRFNPAWVTIAARGTSDHAAIYAQYVLGVRHGLAVGLGTPSVVSLYGGAPDVRDALVIGISQSGESPDIVAVVAAGHAQGAPTIALTNEPTSPLARAADWTIPLGAGPERAISATKTYTTELLAVALLSTALSQRTSKSDRAAQLSACRVTVTLAPGSSSPSAQATRPIAHGATSDVSAMQVTSRRFNISLPT